MPLVDKQTSTGRVIGLWKIEEAEAWLLDQLAYVEPHPSSVVHPHKRKEYLAVRVLVKELLGHMGVSFDGIVKDEFGKPHLKNQPLELSLSHSYPYVAAIVDRNVPVGIDIEQVKDKLLRIAPRILHQQERADAGSDPVKHCVYWCAKEALVKFDGKKGLSFAENLRIDPFVLQPSGRLTGRVIAGKVTVTVDLHYRLYADFVLVYTL